MCKLKSALALTAFLSALAASAPAQTQTSAKYGLKEVQPRTGSNISEYLVPPIGIPINRTYAELSPEDRKKWQSSYEEMKDGDEPPFGSSNHDAYKIQASNMLRATMPNGLPS